MSKIGPKEIKQRALREAQQSSRGGVEGHAESKPLLKRPDIGLVPSAAGIKPGPRKTKPKARSSAAERRTLNPQVGGSNPSAPAKRKRAPRGTFDRTAYQREYMRKRRAARSDWADNRDPCRQEDR